MGWPLWPPTAVGLAPYPWPLAPDSYAALWAMSPRPLVAPLSSAARTSGRLGPGVVRWDALSPRPLCGLARLAPCPLVLCPSAVPRPRPASRTDRAGGPVPPREICGSLLLGTCRSLASAILVIRFRALVAHSPALGLLPRLRLPALCARVQWAPPS